MSNYLRINPHSDLHISIVVFHETVKFLKMMLRSENKNYKKYLTYIF